MGNDLCPEVVKERTKGVTMNSGRVTMDDGQNYRSVRNGNWL
jgi:hypothetical protein